ncbi:unnamed protein product [Caenorhabditis sp. 36 PRJEB53466]|nr:unnamed protein product [Caenorhabditis sp. 36 PRJEB53466]
MMRQDRRTLLERNILKFTTQLRVDDILETLIAKQVLNADVGDAINSCRTDRDKRKEVVKAVQRRGDVAFDAFYDALRDTGHTELAGVLEPLARCDANDTSVDYEIPMSPGSHRRSRALSPVVYTSPTRVHRDSISSISSLTSTFQDVYSRARSRSRSSRALHSSDRHNYTSPVAVFPSQPSSANSSFTGGSLGYSAGRSFSKASTRGQYIFNEDSMNYVDAPHITRVFDEKIMYRNFSNPRGMCLIINNEHFEQMPTRNGTKADKDNITNLFRCMGYTVMCKDNLTARGILLAVRDFAKCEMHGDSAILVILSHGEENVIIGVDDTSVNVQEIYDLLNASNAPRLANKPKLVFVQACRGERRDTGFPVLDAVDGVSALMRRNWNNNSHDGPLFNFLGCVRPQVQQVWRKKPSQADMLIAYATTAQYVSWRNSARGSWFIQAVCEVFSEHAGDMDVVELLTEVNKKVACGFQTSQGSNIMKQMPELTSRLLKKFYFWPCRNSSV